MLFISTFLWMALPYNTGPDMTIQKWVGAIRMLLPDSHKPSPDEIIFIDVSKSRYLVPLDADSVENDVVVNRKYLAELFDLLAANYNQVRYVLCDVIFDISTPDDSSLIQSVAGLQEKFLSIDVYAGNSLNKNRLGVRSATASINLHKGAVYKIPYFGMFGEPLTPFKMYMDLDKGDIRKNVLFSLFSGKGISFNSQINNYPLRSSDFTEGAYIRVGLGELVSTGKLSPEIFDLFLKNRYILIGDFENDLHSTYLNKQPGTLILFNAYLHLHYNRHILSIWYLVLLYFFIYWIVWIQTGKKKKKLIFKLKIKYFKPFKFTVNILSVSLLLMIFSYVSSLLFDVNISIFHLIIIFTLMDRVNFILKKRIKKEQRNP